MLLRGRTACFQDERQGTGPVIAQTRAEAALRETVQEEVALFWVPVSQAELRGPLG